MAISHRLGGQGVVSPAALLTPGALLSVVLLSAAVFPLSPVHLAQFEALNRELGKLCSSNPPRQALSVCRLHAGLLRAL